MTTTAEPEATPTISIVERLEAVWAEPPGLGSWLGTVDHKRIGLRYFYTGMAFFVAGGIESLLIRTQLAGPNLDLLGPEEFNQLFSMHGITMMFLFAMPVLSGFGNYFVPLMIGARDMAFPRLNAFGYWVLLAAGIFLYSSVPRRTRPERRLVQLRAALGRRSSRRGSTSTTTRWGSSSSASPAPVGRSTSS